jgi:ribosomal-protein-alanine N-acetyltransferase
MTEASLKFIFNETLRTQHLDLRLVGEQDEDFMAGLYGDPQIMEYIGPVLTPEQSRQRLHSVFLEDRRIHGGGDYIVTLKETGEKIGFVGMGDAKNYGFGWIIDKHHQKRGYAYEAAQKIMEHLFARGVPYLNMSMMPGNQASIKLAQKLGAHFHNASEYKGKRMLVYRKVSPWLAPVNSDSKFPQIRPGPKSL